MTRPLGAFTGEISAVMLGILRAPCHPRPQRRRQFQKETDALNRKKALAVQAAALKPIVCVGETLPEREANNGKSGKAGARRPRRFHQEQMAETSSPTNPSGPSAPAKPPRPAGQEAHACIRSVLAKCSQPPAKKVRIQYGGSVKPENAKE